MSSHWSMQRGDDDGCSCSLGGLSMGWLASSADPYHGDADALLAKEMYELSVQERNKVLEDVHGVPAAPEETPEFVATSLGELDTALTGLSYAKRKDLDRAFFLKPSLHSDRKFKLMFLRADHFNAKQAAERMARYFTSKLALFGEDKLVKKITLDDLDERDKKILTSDSNVVLPIKDRAGRPIWFGDISKADYEHPASTIRAFWYDTMSTLEDEDAQTKGISCVLFGPGEETLKNMPSISQGSSIFLQIGSASASLPCRLTSFHFGTDDPRMHFVLKTIQTALGKQVRLRLRSHFGSAIEMRYSLLSFGIQCEGLLLDKKGMVSETDDLQKIQREYMARRIEIETREAEERATREATTGIVLYPFPNDVLLGRGRPNQEFSGNRRFADLIDSQMERFQSCTSQFEKTCVIIDVVKMVRDSGGRFLHRTKEGWEVADDKTARKKAGGTFRTRTDLAAFRDVPDSVPSNTVAMATPNNRAKRRKYDPHSII